MSVRKWLGISIGLAFVALVAAGEPGEPAATGDRDKLVRSARILIGQKDHDGARRLLRDAMELAPGDVEVRFLIAQCDERTGDSAEAVSGYSEVLRQMKADPKAGDPAIRRSAAEALSRLDEGAALVRRHAEALARDAERLKGKNDDAYATAVLAAKQLLDSASPTPEALEAASAIDVTRLAPLFCQSGFEADWREEGIIRLHAPGVLRYRVPPGAGAFLATGQMKVEGSVKFRVSVDGAEAFTSEAVTKGNEAVIRVPLPAGSREIELISDANGPSYADHALWVGPRFVR